MVVNALENKKLERGIRSAREGWGQERQGAVTNGLSGGHHREDAVRLRLDAVYEGWSIAGTEKN